MVRGTLEADSVNAALLATPGNGLILQTRARTGDSTTVVRQEFGFSTPVWVRLEVTSSGLVRAYHSSDGTNWTAIGNPQVIVLVGPRYAGLAVCGVKEGAPATATFTNVRIGDVQAPWSHQDIGIKTNPAEPMYVALSSDGATWGTVHHDDPGAAQTTDWTAWRIDLAEFADQGVDLTSVTKMAVGLGRPDDPQAGGKGLIYVDDIRLHPPGCFLSEMEAAAGDLNRDCRVDFQDVEILVGDWLLGDSTRTGQFLVHYKLDEGSGSVAGDSSGHGRDGVVEGGAWTSPGANGTGRALAFDGTGGQVSDPDAAAYLNGLDGLTVALWIKSNEINTDRGFIIFEDPQGHDRRGMRYDVAGGSGGGTNVIKYGVTTTEGNHENESISSLQTTDWQHIAMTWKAGEVARLYVNGAPAPLSFTAAAVGGTTTEYTKLIAGKGGKDQADDTGWNGLIDDIRVYDFALTEAEVNTAMTGGTVQTRDIYNPLVSPANVYDAEPVNHKRVDFRDYAALAADWLDQRLWP
jgi:hypothetical protein